MSLDWASELVSKTTWANISSSEYFKTKVQPMLNSSLQDAENIGKIVESLWWNSQELKVVKRSSRKFKIFFWSISWMKYWKSKNILWFNRNKICGIKS